MTPEQIKKQRGNLGFSQQELADLTFKNIRSIQRYEKGELKPQKLWLSVFEKLIENNEKSC